MAGIYSNKLMEMLIIAGGSITEPRTYKTKEKTKTMGASLDKKDRQ